MAMYGDEKTTMAIDGVDELRRHFEMTREQHAHIRANLARRMKEAITRMEMECKEMSQDLDRINSLYPDVERAEAPGEDYGAAMPARYR